MALESPGDVTHKMRQFSIPDLYILFDLGRNSILTSRLLLFTFATNDSTKTLFCSCQVPCYEYLIFV